MEIFEKPDDALKFAFNFSSEQYALSALGKMMKGNIGSGKGLVGNDGAGQAGMILKRVKLLNEVEQACIICRYNARYSPCNCGKMCCAGESMTEDYQKAILKLDLQVALPAITGISHRFLRHHIIRSYFERSDKQRKIDSVGRAADYIRVPKRTAYDLKDKIERALTNVDKSARTKIGENLADMCGDLPE